ncbi:MAG: imidazole glycerol phosphate synthase subunit HisH [Chitinophagaceae bacterium]
MNVVIIKYNAGNIQSVLYCLERLGMQAVVTDEETAIRKADKVIFPGVGEASSAMNYLTEKGLDRVIRNLEQPVLGICLGMQLLCRHSEENDTTCLNVFDEQVLKFQPGPSHLKVPQIGWNTLSHLRSPLFKGLAEQSYVYFVHSYYVEMSLHTIATAEYGITYSAALQKGNFYGVQFHPEKSALAGETILKNFLAL